jgi:hypothetical protein
VEGTILARLPTVMHMKWNLSWLVVVALCVGAVLGACSGGDGGGSASNSNPGKDGGGTDASGDATPPPDAADGSAFDVSSSDAHDMAIDPQDPVLTVTTGQPIPSVTFEARVNGKPVTALWLVDRGEIGLIDVHTGAFTPGGSVAGVAKVTATVGSEEVSTTVTVKMVVDQNGVTGGGGTGSGGWGGVGGEGPGVPIDAALRAILEGAPTADPSLAWLYPYNGTVWPLGILPPLLQWTQGAAPADAVYIHLTSEHYDYKGFFGRPTALPAGAPLVRHPIPQDVWKAASTSNAGGTLTASIVVAAGGTAYGPISQTWKLARGPLKGTVYYQSYGTALAKNYGGGIGGDGMFGGATLAIRGDSVEPTLVAGSNGGTAACRVCHSVSADGSRMIVQRGDDYPSSTSFALAAGYAETVYPATDRDKFGWVGLSPDGALGLGNAAPLHAGAPASSLLYDMNTGAEVPSTGLASFVTKAGFPAFAPDGNRVAFSLYSGAGNATTGAGDGSQLVSMAFDRASSTFSDPRLLFKAAADKAPGWPSFLPTNDAVVFSVQSRLNSAGEFMMTRYGGKGELWWADLATGTAYPLHRANGTDEGVSYLPSGPNNHQDDTSLHYEPTVNPVVSGGYAWVVFTSRRMYGNVATIDPWASDPREHDLVSQVTPKKLWVAAIDLNAAPGTDPSHPAFYLPAQELMAGNTRGFWVVDPCKEDGEPCETGDECCGGFCQMDGDAGGLICMNHTNECSNEYEKCEQDSDCCDFLTGTVCINERCASVVPK